jgi:glycosyltransferase involved in cell wall biosynthesis
MKEADELPLISVILCFFNEERFLKEAIESVFQQDYDQWELILVDDGSADGSSEIARQISSGNSKVRYTDHPGHQNKGLSASRNLGISQAAGVYVAFIDADDVWLKDKLSYQVSIFQSYPGVTVALEASLYWNSWTSDGKKGDAVVLVGAPEGCYHPPSLMIRLYPLGKGSAPCPSGIMVHRSVLVNCNFEESFQGMYQMYEDQAFLCKVYLHEVVYLSERFHNKYRQRPSSLVSSVHESGKYHVVRNYYLTWFAGYLQDRGIVNAEVNRLLRKARMRYVQPLKYKFMVALPWYTRALFIQLLVKLGFVKYPK